MKKRVFITLAALLGVGGLIGVMGYHPSSHNASADATPQATKTDDASSQPSDGSTSTPTPTAATTQAPTPAPTTAGQYRNGTYSGQTYNVGYGLVQVQAVVSGGRLSNVNLLQMPSQERHSQAIASWAGPQLVQEAVSAQSSNVDIVSGATQDSEGFIASLGSALKLAKS